MKRGGPTHPKTLALAATLKIPRYQAVGILESLWHFAQSYAPRGDVGRHDDDAIAEGVGWEGDPSKLIVALLRKRWLDPCPCHRLRVHDWPDHADQGVQRTKAVIRDDFLECYGTSFLLANDEQKASSDTERHTATAKATATAVVVVPKVGWTAQACDDWTARFHGTAPGGRIGRALKPLVEKHGWEEVRRAWQSYLAKSTDKLSPEHFASTYGAHAGLAPQQLPLAGNGREKETPWDRAERKAREAGLIVEPKA